MAALSASNKYLSVTCGSKAIVLQLDVGNRNVILEPPNLTGQSSEPGTIAGRGDGPDICDSIDDDSKDQQNAVIVNQTAETSAHVVLASFSNCNSWLVLCSNNKQLSLWNTADWSLISNRTIVRTASSVKFTPSGHHLLIADKAGDAYTYSVVNPHEKGALLLGHLSMLMDILLTPNEKHVITCDRDEKIRVSNFPNSYNINTYCLGHEQFVSKINLLPHDLSILTSSSGDGTIRFWDYVSGKLISLINCSNDFHKNNCEVESHSNSTAATEILPVKCFTSCKRDTKESIICASLSGFGGCLVYSVNHNTDHVINSRLLQILSLDAEPWDILLTESKLLWILSHSKGTIINAFTLSESPTEFISEQKLLNEHIVTDIAFVNNNIDMFNCVSSPSGMTVFYKRKYNNLQLYHERKKLRTMGDASSEHSLMTSECIHKFVES